VQDDPRIRFATTEEFAAWIEAQGDAPDGVWLLVPRKGSGLVGISYAEALQVALAHGWIDGQRRGGDIEGVFLQRFTPRRRRSRWSQVNCTYAETLIAEGRMTPRGLAEVEAAKADGRWDAAYPPQSRATLPDELAAAFAAQPGAREFFDSLDSRNRFAVLNRYGSVTRPETRARKAAELTAMMARHEKPHA
jgi:uncharacterized protein YdeI (YjbR/CyaY-like superfamily)